MSFANSRQAGRGRGRAGCGAAAIPESRQKFRRKNGLARRTVKNICGIIFRDVADKDIENFLGAITYPDEPSSADGDLLLRVDEEEYALSRQGASLRLTYRLELADDELVDFACYAPGRFYRDDAVLAVDSGGHAFLWQDIPVRAGASAQRAAFEKFLAACEWWRDRRNLRSREAGLAALGNGEIAFSV